MRNCTVTDHATDRFAERVFGERSTAWHKKELKAMLSPIKVPEMATSFKIEVPLYPGFQAVILNGAVVTVVMKVIEAKTYFG